MFEQDEIHIVHEDGASDGDDSTDEDDSTTPEDTATPEESTDDDCGCPDDSSSTDSSSGGEDTPTAEATATDEDTVSGASSRSTDQDHQAVESGTSTEVTDGAGPGLGVVSALSSLGGIGYLLRRRLGDDESEHDH